MAQTVIRRRPAIDLDALDQALRQVDAPSPAAAAAQAAPADPLAELARLVHGDDPFKTVLPETPRPRVHKVEAVEPQPVQAQPPVPAETLTSPPEAGKADTHFNKALLDELERSLGAPIKAAAPGPVETAAAETRTIRVEMPKAAPSLPLPPATKSEPPSVFATMPEPPAAARSRSPSRKALVIACCVGGAALAGIAGTLAMRGTGKASGTPVIMAKAGPAKERPADPGGTEVPNQNKQVLDKASNENAKAQSAIVSRVEQPVDLSQAVRPDAPPRVAVPQPAAETVSAAPVSEGQPRRVRAVPITANPEPAAAPPPAPAPAAAPAIAAMPPPVIAPAPAPAPAQQPAAPPAAAAPSAPPVAAPAVQPAAPVVLTQPATAAPAPPAAIAAAPPAAAAPVPEAQPKPVAPVQPRRAQPKPADNKNQARLNTPRQPVTEELTEDAPAALVRPRAAAAPARPAPQPAPANQSLNDTPTNSAGGTYFAQLSSSPNEPEARANLARMQQRFGSLGGQMRLVEGQANGTTVYRVRVTGVSADQAGRICSQVRSSGGQCFNQRAQ